jgi:hypothetical protein
MRRILTLAALAVPVMASAQRPNIPDVKIPVLVDPATPASVMRLLRIIADDSMQGRQVWTPGSDRAAKFIAQQMQRVGLTPAGDSGFFQKIPGATQADGRVVRLPSLKDLDTVPAARRRIAVNVVGILPGKGGMKDSIVLVDAHYDHLGVRSPVNGDSIYNGADDDASGTVAVLEIARILKKLPQTSRTVVFVATTGEEAGLVGTRWYLENPVRPLSAMSSNMEIEMIGRPDTIAVGRGRAWLTGYERSTMGETFQHNGLPILADMRPSQSFFTRSDNIAFAQMGIPAHTLSSFNLHTGYHRPSDEAAKTDSVHMASVINVGARAVWVLTEGPQPQWNNGMRPCPAVPRGAGGGGRGRGNGPALTEAQMDSARLANQLPHACAGR